ncbi:hypothetical protein L6164_025986 [Bauhinia variegata]|uniref:Uncharacterized protein n=1 Tax=Bauhinia variegata TaxID=167791 RepID=A0ACB9M2L3_BAUVA|nr:hypothetical protein L6164_025986 [Bauhinia variegata]
MEETKELAEAIYLSSTKIKTKTKFKSLDKDGDEKISAEELKESLESEGYDGMARSNVFSLIDDNQDGYLQPNEFLTLYHVIESNRKVCDHCKLFIPGAYFTCKNCHWEKPPKESYNLCIGCYKRVDFNHEHTEFVDNYTLFAEMRQKLQESYSRSNGEISPPKMRKRDKVKKALKSLAGVAKIGSVATAVTVAAVAAGHQSSATSNDASSNNVNDDENEMPNAASNDADYDLSSGHNY